MAFKPGKLDVETPIETPIYDHGYSDEEVIKIKLAFKELDKRKDEGYILSLEDMEKVIIPHIRIHRTEVFTIQDKIKLDEEEKKRIKREKAQKDKPIKEKKMTKAAMKKRKDFLVEKLYTEGLSDEELKEFEGLQ